MNSYNVNDVVCWTDPDESMCSTVATITDVKGDVFILVTDGGSVIEALADELKIVE